MLVLREGVDDALPLFTWLRVYCSGVASLIQRNPSTVGSHFDPRGIQHRDRQNIIHSWSFEQYRCFIH